MSDSSSSLSADEKRLAALGYKQELNRGWSGFSNFAISLTIICILSGCFTTFGQAWNDGGPIAISIGWPVISLLVLLVGLSMAELASKYPTAGGIYYWAYSLGGVRWAWFTGWFNLLGLVAITAAVDYGCASFLNSVLALYGLHFILNFTTTNPSTILHNTFILFFLILALHSLINVFSSHLVALLNRISAWWMLAGVAVIVGVMIFGPSTHQSFSWVFSHRINNSGFSGHLYWFMILAARLPAHDVHLHRLRRFGALVGGDSRRRARGSAWAVDVDRLLGGRRMGGAARDHVRGDPYRRDQRGRWRRGSDHRVGAQFRPRETRPRHLHYWATVLRDGLRGGRLANGVRVLARWRRAGPLAVATTEQAPDADMGGVVCRRVLF